MVYIKVVYKRTWIKARTFMGSGAVIEGLTINLGDFADALANDSCGSNASGPIMTTKSGRAFPRMQRDLILKRT